jgi:tetratricopeptide (TPR) repeat protein
VLPSDHALISKSYNNIGALLGQLGQYPEAARYQQLSLNMIGFIMGEDEGGAEGAGETVTGDCVADAVAQPVDAERVERSAGGFTDVAEGSACAADEDAAARLRRDSPDVILLGRSLNNMGNLKAKMGLYSEARAYHERSISIIEAAMGTQVRHPPLCASTLSVCCAATIERTE